MTHSAKVPNDDADTTVMRFDGVRGQRYAEIILIAPAETGEMIGSIYNTTGLNDPDGAGDTCPQPLLDQLDMRVLAEEYGIPSVFKNGPRLWCLDWMDIVVGRERDFHGLKARWCMWVDVPTGLGHQEEVAYKPITGRRDTHLGINNGSPAFILDDPDGDTWVMKSVSLIIDPHQTYDAMTNLGERLQLPAGWSYRAVTLEQDLVLTPENGTARILQDDLGNTYDRVGGPFSNYKP
ncbi:hypothetical protein [Arthrobacter sp. NicSoilB8]|uniref:hypothetical protein n=1 Tax=Arthrobacter sp. NicSoilB8 TaxID=2830998 RepID=UPI001CC4B90E|nr:hypothetical protein [Arthrobacter sp. NicSoilB8]BCW71524.1 hypothetical protein NicSoilB8_25680 [Arthrobacter sp. NicSoilB8]